MTVIAWNKSKGLAVDSQGSMGDLCNDVVKYAFINGGVLVGTGKLSAIHRIFNQIENNLPISEFENTTVWYMEADPRGKESKLYMVTKGKWEECLERQDMNWRAMGSGMPYAHVALGAGKTPKEAVELACRLDPTCGGEIMVFNAKGEIAK